MKILMVNKFHYIKGGSETYYFALKKLLETEGHQVIDFSMKDEKNFPSPYEKYFVENVDYSMSGGSKNKLKLAKNIIYSKEAKRKFEKLVLDEKPDLVHLHIFQHQISPSILDVIKKYDLPTVYTAHDLKMICLNYKMMHHGKICEECKGGKYIRCAANKCVKESFAKSCINVVEGYLHKIKKSYDRIDAVITPSKFYKDKFIEFGVAENRLFHIPNFLDKEEAQVNALEDSEKYYLYFGRLSEEKGVMTLLKSALEAGVFLKIVGTGPMYDTINEFVIKEKCSNIQLLGFKSGQELIDLVGNAKAVVLPSEWYENGPYSAIEALQLSRPIIGADIGGIPELIDSNGFLFKSGDSADLLKVLEQFESVSSDDYLKLKNSSYHIYQTYYTAKNHYQKLKQVYKFALDKHCKPEMQ